MIKCGVCGFDNSLGRVHCVQCGTKIDLSKVVPEGAKTKGKGAVVLGRTPGARKSVAKTICKLADLAVLAVIVAALVSIWQETSLKPIERGPSWALAAKGKVETLSAAVRLGTPLPQPLEFSEAEINSYIDDPASPRRLPPPPQGKERFSAQIVRRQIELAEGSMTAVAVGEIKLPNYVKRIVVRVGAELAGEAGGRRLRLTTARIGNLPLHALPWGDRLVELCGKHFFQFEFYDTEWKLIQRASNVRLAAGKAVVSFGGGGAPAARQ